MSGRSVLTGKHFMNGDHACAEGAIAAGCRFFAGYPITPSSEVLHLLSELMPKVGGYLVQTEDELSAIGAVIGAGYASGMSGAEIRAYTLELFGKTSEIVSRLWGLRPRGISEVLSGGTFIPLDAKRTADLFLPSSIPKRFNQLSIPLTVVATDYYGWKEVDISAGELRPAIAASMAIPAIFRPVAVGKRFLVDGGLTNPLPFDKLPPVTVAVAVDGTSRTRLAPMPLWG